MLKCRICRAVPCNLILIMSCAGSILCEPHWERPVSLVVSFSSEPEFQYNKNILAPLHLTICVSWQKLLAVISFQTFMETLNKLVRVEVKMQSFFSFGFSPKWPWQELPQYWTACAHNATFSLAPCFRLVQLSQKVPNISPGLSGEQWGAAGGIFASSPTSFLYPNLFCRFGQE